MNHIAGMQGNLVQNYFIVYIFTSMLTFQLNNNIIFTFIKGIGSKYVQSLSRWFSAGLAGLP